MQLKVIDKPVQEVTNSVRELLGTVTRSEEKESDPGPDLVHSTTLDNASDADPAPYPVDDLPSTTRAPLYSQPT